LERKQEIVKKENHRRLGIQKMEEEETYYEEITKGSGIG
jgi:hypothetical protein